MGNKKTIGATARSRIWFKTERKKGSGRIDRQPVSENIRIALQSFHPASEKEPRREGLPESEIEKRWKLRKEGGELKQFLETGEINRRLTKTQEKD